MPQDKKTPEEKRQEKLEGLVEDHRKIQVALEAVMGCTIKSKDAETALLKLRKDTEDEIAKVKSGK